MGFTEKKFSEAVRLIQRLDAGKFSNDKRRSQRALIQITVDTRVSMSDPTAPWDKCQLCDLSPRGMRLVMRQRITPGGSFLVQFPSDPGRGRPAPLICQVVHCEPQDNGNYIIGAEFTGRLPLPKKNNEEETERIRKSILR